MEQIKEYKEIAEKINYNEVLDRLDAIIHAAEDNTYTLCFMGQFSAGKSRLINNLLERDILPVHITDTTATLTYITHSEEECASVRLTGGTAKSINPEDVKKLWKSSNELPEGLAVNEIEQLDVQLDSDLLKNGLVIVDTPGNNSSVGDNEAVIMRLLNRVDAIVYVMYKPLTYKDELFIQKMIQNGIPFICVRTHAEYNSSEEAAETAMEKERAVLMAIAPDIKIFFTSTEPGNINNKGISELREYISAAMAGNIAERIAESAAARGEVIRQELLTGIKDRLENMKRLFADENSVYEKKLRDIDRKKDALSKTLENKKERIRNGFKEATKAAQNNMNSEKNLLKNKFVNFLDDVEQDSDYTKVIESEAYKQLNFAYEKLKAAHNRAYDKFIRENNEDIINEAVIEFDTVYDYPVPDSIDDIVAERLENDAVISNLQQRIVNLISAAEKLEQSALNAELSGDDLKLKLAELEEEKRVLEELKTELGPYIPQYYVDDSQSKGAAEILGTIGKVADWATLLIPGSAYTKAGAKIAQSTTHLGKMAKAIGGAAKAASKSAKVIDPVKDVLYALKSVSKTRKTKKRTKKFMDTAGEIMDNAKKNAPGLLDYITFEFWFEKLGEKIDGEPQELENLEYKNAYMLKKNEIENRQKDRLNRELQIYDETGRFKAQAERDKYEAKRNEELSAECKQELAMEEKKIRAAAKEAVFRRYKKDYERWFEERLDSAVNFIKEEMGGVIEAICEQYIASCTDNIINHLDEVSKKWDKLDMEFKNLEKDELNVKIKEFEGYLARIGD